ncbi:hypothetical protein [Spirulina subsalsa]|uniref:hypothetical protein n=1 Tax=Spirulina subsalsa TaxID=54311 RepID=UPI0003198E63|nr:hypothetical protein [Spirulina subsalsa]
MNLWLRGIKKSRWVILGFILGISVFLRLTIPSFAHSSLTQCHYKNQPLYGKVKIVENFPDFKIKVVSSFPQLKVQWVNAFPNRCGQWQFVEHFPDFTVQFVEHFPDFTVQFVEHFSGVSAVSGGGNL